MAYKIDRVGSSFYFDSVVPAVNTAGIASAPFSNQSRVCRAPDPTNFRDFGVSYIHYAQQALPAGHAMGFAQLFNIDLSEGNLIAYELEVSVRLNVVADAIVSHFIGVPATFPTSAYFQFNTSKSVPLSVDTDDSLQRNFRSTQTVVVSSTSGLSFCHGIEISSVTGGNIGAVHGQMSLRSIDTSQFLRPYDPVR